MLLTVLTQAKFYSLANGLALDEYQFLNLRAGAILEGRQSYEKILTQCFSELEKCRGFTGMDFRLDEAIRNSLAASYWARTKRDLIFDAKFFTDIRFISTIENPAYASAFYVADIEQRGLQMGGSVIEFIDVTGLGIVRHGSILRHKKLGICWVNDIAISPIDEIKINALFKSDLKLMILGDCTNWSRPESFSI